MENKERERCTECNQTLVGSVSTVWLELSNTDGFYYDKLPEGHISQGYFPFGKTCAHKLLSAVEEAS